MRGRAIVALILGAFILVATGVIWRRSYGFARDRELRRLAERQRALEAERTRLVNDIREASSRARLAPFVERQLQMRVPHDTQVILLRRPARAPQPPPSER